MYLADSKTTEYEKVKEYKDTVASWQREQNFDLFGTLLFTFNCNLNREQRQKQYKRFWNEVDKKIHKPNAVQKYNKRIERFVYEEEGRNRDFLHAHFFCKADNKRQKLAMILVMHDVWKKLPYTQPLHIVENTNNDNRDGYGIKEYRLNSNEQLFTECCYLRTQMKKRW